MSLFYLRIYMASCLEHSMVFFSKSVGGNMSSWTFIFLIDGLLHIINCVVADSWMSVDAILFFERLSKRRYEH